MEIIILVVALAALVFVVARKMPEVSEELLKRRGNSNGEAKLNRYEASEETNGKKSKKTSKSIPRFVKQKSNSADEVLEKVGELIDQKNHTEAEKILISTIEKDPKNPKLYNKLGVIYIEQENFADAKEAFRTALKYDKNNDLIHNNLGLALFNQGRYVEAIEAYQRSIQLNGLVPHRYINLGLSYAALRQYDKALDSYKKALVLEKDNEDYQQLIKEATEKMAELRVE